jgi:hypothetical protein
VDEEEAFVELAKSGKNGKILKIVKSFENDLNCTTANTEMRN